MKSARSLQTVLFTDIVGSTERATEMGDRAWRELLRRHDARVRAELLRHVGTELNTAGDGFVAAFADPVRAILCADSIRDALGDLGLDVRCGLHMGQVEGAGAEASGIAVHIGARVAADAGAGEIVVSRAVRDTVEGSGFVFEDLGTRELKGARGEWRLFRLTGLPDDAAALAPGGWERLRHRVGPRRAAAVGTLAVVVALGGYAIYRVTGPEAALASSIRSIAVLPLDNLTGDPDQDYFADGMTEALITELSKLGAVKVISRRSVLRYRGTDTPVPEIADALGVDGVIEGSVVKDGDRVRITAQLIHGGADVHLWAQSYDGTIEDVLVLQSTLARDIAREIQIAISPEVEAQLTATGRVNPETYEAYLKGMLHIQRMNPTDTQKGLEYLHEATEKNPGDALAWAGLAQGYANLGHSPASPPDAWQMARAAAERALKLDPDLAEAHAALADVRTYWEWDWDGAQRSFRRANELNPNLAMNHYHYAWYLDLFGRLDEAIAEHELARDLDPLTPLHTAWLGLLYVEAGRIDEGIAEAEKAIALDPEVPVGALVLGMAYAAAGRFDEAIATHRALAEAFPPSSMFLGLTYAQAGRRAEAERILAALESQEPSAYNALGRATLNAAIGNADEAFRWVEYEPHHAWLPWIRVNPIFEPYHDDPRLLAAMERMGLPPPEARVAHATDVGG